MSAGPKNHCVVRVQKRVARPHLATARRRSGGGSGRVTLLPPPGEDEVKERDGGEGEGSRWSAQKPRVVQNQPTFTK